ncbi:glutathione S-transferase C-terminal-like protein [Pisolithus orientalis]|uniref:glutathione S-transferase C-terminal-like protein n=1 Tax=Pisolithus orientalis TaxID=936130 RepID=UPI0022246A30|nr:glutathione S-transferase C-terminal-like protein [Pisolithus orientalis]KAI5998956.1 glutathione S-transferase C-terminal-like protein [Pisolithus orientalis]
MTPIGKMYGYGSQPQTKAILSVATSSNLEIELLPFEYGVTNQSPEFTLKFPLAKIPAFESLNGFNLTEGAAIARYGLLGRNAEETALVDQWVHFAEFKIYMDRHKWHEERIVRSLRFLDNYLEKRPSGLLVNDNITLADIFLAVATERAGQTTCGNAERKQTYPHVFAHHAKVTSDERIKDVLGEPGFIEERLVYN